MPPGAKPAARISGAIDPTKPITVPRGTVPRSAAAGAVFGSLIGTAARRIGSSAASSWRTGGQPLIPPPIFATRSWT